MVNVTEEGLKRSIYSPEGQIITRLILAHGAGAGNKHEFMHAFSLELAKLGVEVVSFNFPYMQTAYELDKKRPPNGNKVLCQYFLDELNGYDDEIPTFIGGKSMGGRIATQVLNEAPKHTKGCLVLGYPFIPPGKPEKLEQRMAHFDDITRQVLIMQGERDTFGNLELLSQFTLPETFNLAWIKSGDHSFKPLKSSGTDLTSNIREAARLSFEFMQQIVG